jgi:serine/threonine-protein kinase
MLADRYEIRERIGSGGMARVMRAFDLRLEREVAVKMLHDDLLEKQEIAARFMREARIFAKLRHAHIVEIHDILHFEGDDQRPGGVAMVMELIDGMDAARTIRGLGPVRPEVAAIIVRAVADALAYAHHQGIVHRDVKPANVLLGRDGRVKLSDFGIARLGEDSKLTRTGDFMGTPAYCPPEQAEGRKVADTADQYALGVVLYELVTGAVPFEGPSALAVLRRIVEGDYTHPRTVRPDLSEPLSGVITRAMQVHPQDRFADMPAFLDALDAAAPAPRADRARRAVADLVGAVEAGGREPTAVPSIQGSVPPPPAPAPVGDTLAPTQVSAPPEPLATGPGRVWVPVAGVALLVAGAAVGLSMVRGGGATDTPDAMTARVVSQDAGPVAAARPSPEVASEAAGVPDAAVVVVAPAPAPTAHAAEAAPKVVPRKRTERAGRASDRKTPSKVQAAPAPAPTPAKPRQEAPEPAPAQPAMAADPPPPEPARNPKPFPGTLAIHTWPWADVWIDGRKRGTTPYLKTLELPPGTHRLELRNPGFVTWSGTVEIQPGRTLERRIRLKKGP